MERKTYKPRVKEDLRVHKTRMNLYSSFLKVLDGKDFISMTITDICREAGINRSTYYDHFKDKYELLNSFIKESTDELKSLLQDNPISYDLKNNILNHLEVLLCFIEDHRDIYSTFISLNQSSLVLSYLLDAFLDTILSKEKYSSKNQFLLSFYSSASIGVIVQAMKNIDTFNKNKLLRQIKKLIPEIEK